LPGVSLKPWPAFQKSAWENGGSPPVNLFSFLFLLALRAPSYPFLRPDAERSLLCFYSFAHGSEKGRGLYYDCHKIEHMQHDQTILAYEMNGKVLPECHGAPLRLRNELELGFKSVKWVQSFEFVESFTSLGLGEGGFTEDYEFYTTRNPI
jgi:methionine sulfoxide reductase catalytic subunit